MRPGTRRKKSTATHNASTLQYDATGNLTNADPQNIRASYISAGADRVLARQSPTDGTYHYLSDALGSTTRLANDNGNTQ